MGKDFAVKVKRQRHEPLVQRRINKNIQSTIDTNQFDIRVDKTMHLISLRYLENNINVIEKMTLNIKMYTNLDN